MVRGSDREVGVALVSDRVVKRGLRTVASLWLSLPLAKLGLEVRLLITPLGLIVAHVSLLGARRTAS